MRTNTFYVIGVEKGWFKDVGITITPEPDGKGATRTEQATSARRAGGRTGRQADIDRSRNC